MRLTACELLNDAAMLMDLRKNTENCSNNRKSCFERNFFTMASFGDILSAGVSLQWNELGLEECLVFYYQKNQFPEKVKFSRFLQILSHLCCGYVHVKEMEDSALHSQK